MTTSSTIYTQSPADSNELQCKFSDLVVQWHEETDYLSSMSRKLTHPAYLHIIAIGSIAVPWILHELECRPGYWFHALNAITGEAPTQPGADFEQARLQWLVWGRQKGHLQ